jgi:hypothetical protein
MDTGRKFTDFEKQIDERAMPREPMNLTGTPLDQTPKPDRQAGDD